MVRSDNPTLISNKRIEKNPTGWYIQRVRLNKLGKIQWSDNAIQKSQKDIPLQVIHLKTYQNQMNSCLRTFPRAPDHL